MKDSTSNETNNALKPMQLHLLANIHNVAASSHFRQMRVGNVNESISKAVVPTTSQQPQNSNGSANSSPPDYQSLFGGNEHCECAECRSVFGPAAYFVDLMRTEDEEISKKNPAIGKEFKLASRRPDLREIPLTCEKTTQQVSYLQIVNEILARQVNNLANPTADIAKKPINQVVDDAHKTLATKALPFRPLFNRPLEQIRACLRQEKTGLPTVYKLFKASDAATAREILGLSMEEYKLLVTPQADDSKELTEMYGVTAAKELVDGLKNLDVVCQKTGLSEQELHELFLNKLKDINGHALYINKDLGNQRHKITGKTIENLTLPSLDRIHRFVRLAKKLHWSFADLDWALKSVGVDEINESAIIAIAKIKQLQDRFKVPLDALCSLWHDPKTIGEGDSGSSRALFDRVSGKEIIGKAIAHEMHSRVAHALGTSANELTLIAKAFSVVESWEFTEAEFTRQSKDLANFCKVIKDAQYNGVAVKTTDVKTTDIKSINELLRLPSLYDSICAKKPGSAGHQGVQNEELAQLATATNDIRKKKFNELNSQEQLLILKLNRLALQAAHPGQCPQIQIPVYTVSNLSIRYRHSKLAAWLNLPVANYLLLLDILGMKKPKFSVADVFDIAAKTDWIIKHSGFTIPELYYVVKGFGDTVPGNTLDKAIAEFLKSLRAAHSARRPDFEVKLKDIRWQASDKKVNNPDDTVKNTFIDAFIACVKDSVNESFTKNEFTAQGKSISGLCKELNGNKALTIQVPNSSNNAADEEWLQNLNVALEKNIPGLTGSAIADNPLITAMRDRITQSTYDNNRESLTKKLNRLAIELAFPQHAPNTLRFLSSPNAKRILEKEQISSSNQTRKLNRLLLEHLAPGQLAKADIKQLDDEWRKDLVKRLAEFLGGNAEIVDALFDVVARHINLVGYNWAAGCTNYIDEFLYEPSKQPNNDNKEAFVSNFIYLLHRWLLLAQKLQLTPAEISSIKAHPARYGIDDKLTLSFVAGKNLHALKSLEKDFDDKEGKLIAFLDNLKKGEAGQIDKQFREGLSKITKWQEEQIDQLIEHFQVNASEVFNNKAIETLAKFREAFELAKSLGVDIAYCLRLTALAEKSAKGHWQDYTETAQSIVNMARAKHGGKEWEKTEKKLLGGINELSRDALAEYVLCEYQNKGPQNIKNLRQLSEHLLIDVEMSGCASASYIQQAILSLQTYLQRCRMGLEEGVSVNIEESRWKLLMSYREWEASRRVFLYPENYLAAAPRKDRTDLFRTLEDTLLQTNITQEAVENAYKDYLDSLIELANLKISTTCRYRIDKADGGKQDTLFLFGRTRSEPHAYYYRRCIEPTSLQPSWLPWSKIDLEIKAEEIAPAFAFGKLFLFWVETTKTTETTNTGDGKTEKKEIVKAAIKYSYLKVSDKWMQAQTLAKDIDVSAYDGKFGAIPVFPFVTSKKDGNPEQIYIVIGRAVSVGFNKLYKPILPVYLLSDNLAVRQENPSIGDNILYGVAKEILPPPHCLGYWAINEGAGNSVSDLISKKALTAKRDGGGDAAWKSINDHPRLPGIKSVLNFKDLECVSSVDRLDYTLDGITVEAWVKLEKVVLQDRDSQKIVGCRDNTNKTGFSLAVDNKGHLFPEIWSTTKNEEVTTFKNSEITIKANTWTHLAFTWEKEGKLIGYINGKKAGEQAGKKSSNLKLDSNLVVGAMPWDTKKERVSGHAHIADICIWDGAFNAAEIKVCYSGQPPFFTMVKNQPGWYLLDTENDAFLVIPLESEDKKIVPFNETATLSQDKLSYATSTSPVNKFRGVRLSTGAVRPLAQKALIGGLDHLLTLDSQLIPETDFEKLKLDKTKFNPPGNDSLDFYGSYGCYFQEIFFHIPFLIANTLSDHRRFEEARKWYHYVFNPAIPLIQTPEPKYFWRIVKENNDVESFKNQNDNDPVKIEGMAVVKTADFPSIKSKSVLKFQGNKFVDTKKELPGDLSAITISVWVKLTDIDADQKIISNATVNAGNYSGFVVGVKEKKPYFEFFDEKHTQKRILSESSIDIAKDKWTNLVATWSKGGYLTAYINGKPVARKEATNEVLGNGTGIVFGAPSWQIETSSPQYRLAVGSQIAEVRIWDKKLSLDDVSLNYNPANRFWRYRPFHNSTLLTLDEILSNEQAIRAYDRDPLDPHAIARLRMGAYEKAVVMKYIDNLIHWGDACFAKDTWESITQASTLYMLAYDLLGSKPAVQGQCSAPSAGTYKDLSSPNKPPMPTTVTIDKQLTALHAKLAAQAPKVANKSRMLAPVATLFKDAADFCIPENEQFTGYWQKVEDQLFKIRHCQNIKGMERELALFEPRLDSLELVRAATSGSVPLRMDIDIPVPLYRFEYSLEKAKNLAATVIQLGSSLLGILERKDSEELAALQAGQERALLKLIHSTRKRQKEESEANLEALRKSREAATHREAYYQKLLKDGLSGGEVAGTVLRTVACEFELGAANANYFSSAFYFLPNIFGLSNGGHSPGAGLQAIAAGNSNAAGVLNGLAGLADNQAQYQRRQQEWEQQLQTAQDDAAMIEQQIRAAEINVQIAETELKNHEKSLEQAEQLENFLKSKFTTPELYRWLAGRLSLIYFETFKLALEMALSAQKAYQYELDKTDSYIVFDYWDSLKQGLLAGEGLTLCLHQLEKAYIEGNERRFEIEKTISLKNLLTESKFEAGRKQFQWKFGLKDEIFDNDFPGHYCRRIKTLFISIPAVVGPYENINATLIQTGSTIRKKPGSAPESDFRRRQKIALSRGINDSGLFELDFRDVRYLPFEGTGAVSDWELHIPKENNPKLNYESLTDVIIHLRYTALDGS